MSSNNFNERKEWLKEEWKKSTNLDNYKVGEYHSLILTDDCPYGSDWYPESPYELDEDRVADWWLNKIDSLLQSQEAEIKRKVLEVVDRSTKRFEFDDLNGIYTLELIIPDDFREAINNL